MIRSCGLVAQASRRQGVDILEADVGSEVALGVGVCVSAVRARLHVLRVQWAPTAFGGLPRLAVSSLGDGI